MSFPIPMEEPLIDDHRLLRELGFRNSAGTEERLELRPIKKDGEFKIPPWFVGLHYRLAPCISDVEFLRSEHQFWLWRGVKRILKGRRSFQHLFDAIPMLQRFEIGPDGKVHYSSRILGSRVLDAWQGAQGGIPSEHESIVHVQHTHVGWSHSSQWRKKFDLPDKEKAVIGSSITSDFPLGPYHGAEGRLLMHQEGVPIMQEVDFQAPLGKELFSYSLINREFCGTPCPNPLTDPETKELVNVLVDYGKDDYATYRIISIPHEHADSPWHEQPIGKVMAKFKAPPALVSSFCITPSYVVIPLYPLYYRATDQPSVFKNGGFIDGLYDRLQWNPQGDTLFYVVSRRNHSLAAVYRSEACFAFHAVNAFESEDGNSVYMDLCAYEDVSVVEALELHHLRSSKPRHTLPTPLLRRYIIPHLREESAAFFGAAGQLPRFPTAPYHTLLKQAFESPVISPNVIGKQATLYYGLSLRKGDIEKLGAFWNSIIRVDPLYLHEILEWSETGCFPSPPVYVPCPGDPREESGVLITTVLDVLRKRSFLLILEAGTMKALGRYWLPVAVSPSLLGGCWVQTLLGPEVLSEASTE